MKVENIMTGELVRIPRKLSKRLQKKHGYKIDAAFKARYGMWALFVLPRREWVVIKKIGLNYRG